MKHMKPIPTSEIQEMLTQKGLKITSQRLRILDYLLNHAKHPTADEVYEAVGGYVTRCSRATVYNTLNSLVDAGLIDAFSNELGKTRYDGNFEKHHHFIDVRTGEIYDIPWDQVDPPKERMGAGFRVTGYRINFYGEAQSPPKK